MAAGALIVSEAGGSVSRLDGGSFDLAIPDILTSNGTSIQKALVELLK
jgi:fructose-1,6-bisphosphatase/inositol monophosphatase family enzyme